MNCRHSPNDDANNDSNEDDNAGCNRSRNHVRTEIAEWLWLVHEVNSLPNNDELIGAATTRSRVGNDDSRAGESRRCAVEVEHLQRCCACDIREEERDGPEIGSARHVQFRLIGAREGQGGRVESNVSKDMDDGAGLKRDDAAWRRAEAGDVKEAVVDGEGAAQQGGAVDHNAH